MSIQVEQIFLPVYIHNVEQYSLSVQARMRFRLKRERSCQPLKNFTWLFILRTHMHTTAHPHSFTHTLKHTCMQKNIISTTPALSVNLDICLTPLLDTQNPNRL